MQIGQYKKLIAAIIGVAAIIFGPDVLGLTQDSETTAQLIMGLMTTFGVFRARNTPPDTNPIRDMKSPALVALLAAVFTLMLSGCVSTSGVDAERLDTTNKQLADKVVTIKSLATLTRNLNARRVITPQQAQQVAERLDEMLQLLNTTQAAVAASGDPSQATSALDRVDRSLALVLELLTALAPANGPTYYTPTAPGVTHAYSV